MIPQSQNNVFKNIKRQATFKTIPNLEWFFSIYLLTTMYFNVKKSGAENFNIKNK